MRVLLGVQTLPGVAKVPLRVSLKDSWMGSS